MVNIDTRETDTFMSANESARINQNLTVFGILYETIWILKCDIFLHFFKCTLSTIRKSKQINMMGGVQLSSQAYRS